MPDEFQYNQTIDFANLKLAEGLMKVPGLLDEGEKSKGEYVLALHGNLHVNGPQLKKKNIVGIERYLTDNNLREAKKILYSFTYGIVADNYLRKFKCINDSWREVASLHNK